MLLVNSIHGTLETTEKGLRTEECGGKIDCVGEFIDYFMIGLVNLRGKIK